MTQTTTLAPNEWKQLALLNAAEFQNYLLSIPAMADGGSSGLTDEHMTMIEGHLARGQSFLNAWRRSRAVHVQAVVQPMVRHTNGAEVLKRKGGWPKGKKRTRQNPAVTQ